MSASLFCGRNISSLPVAPALAAPARAAVTSAQRFSRRWARRLARGQAASAGGDIGFALLRPQHQLGEGGLRRADAVDHGLHLLGDGQLDAVARAEIERGLGGAQPLGDHALPAQDVLERAAAAELDADLAVAAAMAGAGQHEIAEPAEAGQRVGTAAHRRGQPRDLDEAAGDERGHRVVPEAEALDDARGDRDDVLERAANLDAGDVVRRVQPQRRSAELLLDEACRLGGRRRHHDGRRQPRRDLGRERRSRQHRDRPGRPGLVGDHLRHREERAVLEALGGADERHGRRRDRDRADAPRRAGPATAPRRPPAWRRRRRPRSRRWDGRRRRGRRRADSRRSRAPPRDGRPARRPGPTGARRVRGAPGARPARCPSCLPRERRWCA